MQLSIITLSTRMMFDIMSLSKMTLGIMKFSIMTQAKQPNNRHKGLFVKFSITTLSTTTHNILTPSMTVSSTVMLSVEEPNLQISLPNLITNVLTVLAYITEYNRSQMLIKHISDTFSRA